MERHSREFNLKFYGIPETSKEDCIVKLKDILNINLGLHPQIENAHRIGGHRNDGKPRPIIAKFLHRPERHQIFIKRKELANGIWISEDLIWEDRQKKKQLRNIMQEAYNRGQKPRFHHGSLYIDGHKYTHNH